MQFTRPKYENTAKLRIISLGGFGNVTCNMFVYELPAQDKILLVDCGVGFPSEDMLGVDLLIPDISYLKDKKDKIAGMVLTHGHDDHIGALPYILPQLPVPVYTASPLTAGFAQLKMTDAGLTQRIIEVDPNKELKLGPFNLEFVRVNHSTPDAFHIFINTPSGNIYHGPDYKFDYTSVDRVKPDLVKITQLGSRGIVLLLTDCLGSENRGATPSEEKLNEMFDREIARHKGRIIITTLSSNISRFSQAISASLNHGRKVALVGKSLEKKVELAIRLSYLDFSKGSFVSVEQAMKLPENQVTLLVSGSQGQPGSAMDRIANSEHKQVSVKKGDKIIFSSPDYIPGTEGAVKNLIDRLILLGADVVYSDIAEDLHVGGHGGQQDMKLLLSLCRPGYVVPIGGETRHMKQYSLMAQKMGFPEERILLPLSGDIIEIKGGNQVAISGKLPVRNVMVDGLGVGDVGHVVLRDRQVLAEEGIVIVVIQMDHVNKSLVSDVDVISRGFVYAKENEELLALAKDEVKRVVLLKAGSGARSVREAVVEKLERYFFQKTHRSPMVIPVVVEV